MNRIDWLIVTGGNPCFGLEALIPILTPLIGETAAGIAGPAVVGGLETAAGGAALGGLTGGGQGALRGAEVGGLTGAGIFGGGPAATALGLPATVGTTVGGVAGGALGGEATGQNPLLTGAIGGVGGLGAGLSGVGGTTAAPAAAAPAPMSAPTGGAMETAIPPGISSYSDQLGAQGGLYGPQTGATVQTDIVQGALPQDPFSTGAGGIDLGTLSFPAGGGGGGGGVGGSAPLGTAATMPDVAGAGTGTDPGLTYADPTGPTGTNPFYAPGTDVTIAHPGSTDSGIMSFLGNPTVPQLAGAGLSGIGLLTSAMRPNQYAGLENQLQQQATGAAGTTTALQSPLFTGIMPPGVQQNINQQKQDAAAAIRSGFARTGMAGSTSEAQQIAAENARIDASKIGIAENMFNQAANYAQLAPADLQRLYTIQSQQDAAFQRQLQNFVAALAGGRGGTSQPATA